MILSVQVSGVEGFRGVALGRMFFICFGGIGDQIGDHRNDDGTQEIRPFPSFPEVRWSLTRKSRFPGGPPVADLVQPVKVLRLQNLLGATLRDGVRVPLDERFQHALQVTIESRRGHPGCLLDKSLTGD